LSNDPIVKLPAVAVWQRSQPCRSSRWRPRCYTKRRDTICKCTEPSGIGGSQATPFMLLRSQAFSRAPAAGPGPDFFARYPECYPERKFGSLEVG